MQFFTKFPRTKIVTTGATLFSLLGIWGVLAWPAWMAPDKSHPTDPQIAALQALAKLPPDQLAALMKPAPKAPAPAAVAPAPQVVVQRVIEQVIVVHRQAASPAGAPLPAGAPPPEAPVAAPPPEAPAAAPPPPAPAPAPSAPPPAAAPPAPALAPAPKPAPAPATITKAS